MEAVDDGLGFTCWHGCHTLDPEKWKDLSCLSESFFTNVDCHHDRSTPKSKLDLENTSQCLVLYSNMYSYSDILMYKFYSQEAVFLTDKPSELQVSSNLASFLTSHRKKEIKRDTSMF